MTMIADNDSGAVKAADKKGHTMESVRDFEWPPRERTEGESTPRVENERAVAAAAANHDSRPADPTKLGIQSVAALDQAESPDQANPFSCVVEATAAPAVRDLANAREGAGVWEFVAENSMLRRPRERIQHPIPQSWNLVHPERAWLVPTTLALLALVALIEGVIILGTRTTNDAARPPQQSAVPTAFRALEASRPPSASAVGLLGTTSAAVTQPVEGATLVVRTEPPGADISINGLRAGKTPMTLDNVVPGDHRIDLALDDIQFRQTVPVAAGATVSVIVPLWAAAAATPGWIAVKSPIELDIFEEGTLLGTSRSPRIMVREGERTLHLSNESIGYRERRRVRVEKGKTASISIALADGRVHINAVPWAEVWVDGKSVGDTPIGNLPISLGPHQIVFRHPELGEKTVSTLVKPGAPVRVTADMRPK